MLLLLETGTHLCCARHVAIARSHWSLRVQRKCVVVCITMEHKCAWSRTTCVVETNACTLVVRTSIATVAASVGTPWATGFLPDAQLASISRFHLA